MRAGFWLGVLTALAMTSPSGGESPYPDFDPQEVMGRHPIVRDRPGPDFFDGALLGNGGLGAVVTTRPDAVVIHFGHNNVWDIRIAEDNKDRIGTFKDVFEKVKAIPADIGSLKEDPWFADYMKLTRANYDKPYPRPFPCGSLILGFDRRKVEMLGYHLDIATGLCVVNLLADSRPAQLQLFVDMTKDLLWVRLVDEKGEGIPNLFNRIRLLPDPETPKDIPLFHVEEGLRPETLSFLQILPFNEPVEGAAGEPDRKDRAFRLSIRASGPLEAKTRINWEGHEEVMGPLERLFVTTSPLIVVVKLEEGRKSEVEARPVEIAEPSSDAFDSAFSDTRKAWREYWSRSAISLDDEFLERIWYWNHYFFQCAAKAGVDCPGLFANWSYRKIGTAWHGDYHMNYNTQQPFWLPFSSNRIEKNLPYVELVERLLPLSRKWAKEYYGLRGAYFPHSAYPVEMSILPYPVPTWGWEICETPWTVQGLWWHYLYTMDKAFLKDRAFGPIRESVLFLVDYMKRPEARGPQWGDDRHHVFPTVPPELYGLRPGFKFNHDCLVDLTLIRFVMKAYLDAARVLEIEGEESELIADVRDILNHFPDYPTADSPQGKVFVSVPGESADTVYNTPNSLMTVFPGEDHGLHSPPEIAEILRNTWRNNQNEGGNDLVFLNLQGARIGLLDLERFKRQIRYCLLPNGTCTDLALQVGGRYSDTTPFDFMAPMGIWFENFGLPVVINECLMQSYNGTIRLFPNWPKEKRASFKTLRAVGAFLVSASCSGGQVDGIEILSETGGVLRLHAPWEEGARVVRATGEEAVKDALIELKTGRGERLRFFPADSSTSSQAAPSEPSYWSIYIGTYTEGESEGIYLLRLDSESGEIESLGLAGKAANPSFLAIHPTLPVLYSTGNMDGAEGIEKGGVSAYAIRGDGKLTALNHRPSIGAGPCHVAVDRVGRHVLLANYSGGSVTAIALDETGRLGESTAFVQHEGSSVNPNRQEGPHAHSVTFDPVGRFAFVADLGVDKIKIYRFDDRTGSLAPNDPPEATVAPGAGPRHFAFHPSGKFAFAINELHSTITAFTHDPEQGRLVAVTTVSTLPSGFEGSNTTAEIRVHPNGRWVYGSNRGHDSIASFEFDPERRTLTPLGHTFTGGSTPRNFNLDPTGRFLLAANQKTGNVVVLRIDPETGIPQGTGKSVEIPSPVCVLFVNPESASR